MEWISVEERLPENDRSVLVIQETGYENNRVTIVAKYARKFQLESNGETDDFDEYSEDHDAYFCPEGWYENQFNWEEYSAIYITEKVTHWMELPKKPPQT